MMWGTKASAKDVMDEAVKTHKLLQRHGSWMQLTSIWGWGLEVMIFTRLQI